MSGLIWSGLLVAYGYLIKDHYYCNQESAGVRLLSWVGLTISAVLLLRVTFTVADKLRVNSVATAIVAALAMAPFFLVGTLILYSINSAGGCGE